MAGFLPAGSTHHGGHEGGAYKVSHDNPDEYGGRWYLPGKEIEENSPSRRDGIDLKKETYLRKSYCTFLQDLGMRLKVLQATRKVEETPRPLKDVIIVSYEIIYKKDPAAAQRIKQKEVYEQQKELILVGERLVLATLGFDLNVLHPYKPLVEAIKKFKVSQKALAQVAWNFVNDGLRTSLCLQFKPDHIAAGAIFLAAKFLKVKLPSDGEKVWWQEFDVTPRQLEEVSNQMLELYEQNRVPLPQPREAEVSAGAAQWPPTKAATTNENHVTSSSNSQGGAVTLELRSLKPTSSWSVAVQSHGDSGRPSRIVQCQNNECGRTEAQGTSSRKREGEIDDNHYHEKRQPLPHPGKTGEHQNESRSVLEGHDAEDQEGSVKRIETRDVGEVKDKHLSRTLDKDSMPAHSPQDAIKKIDKDKVKAALEKRRKSRGNIVWKTDFMDEDDLIERELEQGIEFVAESENNEQERKQISAL